MVAKRALVVDDSRSARAFLVKLLEEQQIKVDTAESAEQAIDYLVQNRPDVIFMDHLMPGMDGFQAVQAIKANSRTADIPILMYTSQEGELYQGQARALGAAGVVQKNMAPEAVHALLRQLKVMPGQEAAAPRAPAAGLSPKLKVEASDVPTVEMQAPALGFEELLREEAASLRRELADTLKVHAAEMTRAVRSMVTAVAPAAPAPLPAVELAPPPAIVPEKPRQSPLAWWMALAASVAAAVLGTLWVQGRQQVSAARAELMDSKSTVALLTARLAPEAQAADVVLPVPFGEAALAGARIDALREVVTRFAAPGQTGTFEVRFHPGRFCVAGNANSGFALAGAEVPASKCDLVVLATDPLLGKPVMESPAFMTALNELRRQHPDLTFDVAATDAAAAHAYPEAVAGLSASAWNAVAAANNRVEIRWRPAQ